MSTPRAIGSARSAPCRRSWAHENGGPHPGENLARKNLFHDSANQGFPRTGGHRALFGRLGRDFLESPPPAIQAGFGGHPIFLNIPLGDRQTGTDEYGTMGGDQGGQFGQFACVHCWKPITKSWARTKDQSRVARGGRLPPEQAIGIPNLKRPSFSVAIANPNI